MSHPFSFYLSIFILITLILDYVIQRRQAWALPALLVYLTVFAWYFLDIFLYPEKYEGISDVFFSSSYWQICLFLVVFRTFVPSLARWLTRPTGDTSYLRTAVNAETLFKWTVVLWAFLLLIAVSQLKWNFFAALFPMDSRAGDLMWQRGAAASAGPFGFLISTGGYLYMVSCSFFGILAIIQKQSASKWSAIGMIFLTWPFYLLSGTRNAFLAVCMPCLFTYFLFGRQQKIIRLAVLVGALLTLNLAFKVVISYRGTGFREFFSETTENKESELKESKHEGLNMLEELCYINSYFTVDKVELGWGVNYWAQVVSIVPRAIWANKPLQGIEYAKWRGFEDTTGASDIGVVATISTGLIGQGILEFGPWFGAVAPALLMALWCGLLARWWTQRMSVLRLCLFLLGVGLTFNLGRNITMIILWPVAFAYILVRIVETASAKSSPRSRLNGTGQTRNPLPQPVVPHIG